MADTENCLLVFFNEVPDLALLKCGKSPPVSLVHKNRQYHARLDNGWNGFYDWLRTDQGSIVGITWFCIEEFYFLRDIFKNLSYVTVQGAQEQRLFFDIFLLSEPVSDYRSSGDQDFGYNWYFETESGEFALSFRAENVVKFLSDIDEIEHSSFGELGTNLANNTKLED